MTHEYKVGDKVTLDHGDFGVCTLTQICAFENGAWWWKNDDGEKRYSPERTMTPYRVPVGYTGKLKDMDLREGDVVSYRDVGPVYTYEGPVYTYEGPRKLKASYSYLSDIYFEGGSEDYLDTWVLISRADTKPWSNWHMSRKDGTYDTHPNREYETHALPDTDQVTYRWRDVAVKEPVVTTQECNVHYDLKYNEIYNEHPDTPRSVNATITVTLHDNIPVSGTLEFNPKPPS